MKLIKRLKKAGTGKVEQAIIIVLIVVVATGCDFGVTNPGKIMEKDLNTVKGMETLVTGMSADFSYVFDDIAFTQARLSDELAASGSYYLSTRLRYGMVDPEDVNFYWEGIQQARFVAENGIERMNDVLGDDFNGNPLAVRAYFFAGLSNRVIGDTFGRDVVDGGEAKPSSTAFERAIAHFENAVAQAQQAGMDDYVTAANGGLAQVYMGLGQWDKAVQHAQEVPTYFVHLTVYSNNSGRESNEYRFETHDRYEASAFNTLGASYDPQDPRTPFTDCRSSDLCSAEVAADGQTPMLRQEKFPELGSDIPVVKGTEMRLIEAEAALLDNDLQTAMDKINEVRDHHGLNDLTATGIGELGGNDRNDAWDILDRERHLTLWLEGRRLLDLRRWDHYFLYGGTVVYEGVSKRAAYLPVADSECATNENVTCEKPYTR